MTIRESFEKSRNGLDLTQSSRMANSLPWKCPPALYIQSVACREGQPAASRAESESERDVSTIQPHPANPASHSFSLLVPRTAAASPHHHIPPIYVSRLIYLIMSSGASSKVFVGGLAVRLTAVLVLQSYSHVPFSSMQWETNNDALRTAFEKFGPVEDCYVISDRETGAHF